MKEALKEYFGGTPSFEGRMSRRTYWMAYLGILLLMIAYGIVAAIIGSSAIKPLVQLLSFVVSVTLLIYGISAIVKRLHDTNKTGAYLLWALVPIIGTIILLIALLSKGDIDDNNYGSSPQTN